jgi:hypothetical protein
LIKKIKKNRKTNIMITLAQIESDIAAGFADTKIALGYVEEALPVIEAVDPSVAADVQTAVGAANKLAPVISDLLAKNEIDQTTHDALQNRIGAVANPSVSPNTKS